MDKMKSRKLCTLLLFTVVMLIMCWFEKVTSSELTSFMTWSLGIYTAGNVGTKFSGGIK